MGNIISPKSDVTNSLENNSTDDNGEFHDKPQQIQQISSKAARSTTGQSITNRTETMNLQNNGDVYMGNNVAKKQHEPKEKDGDTAMLPKQGAQVSSIGSNSSNNNVKQTGSFTVTGSGTVNIH